MTTFSSLIRSISLFAFVSLVLCAASTASAQDPSPSEEANPNEETVPSEDALDTGDEPEDVAEVLASSIGAALEELGGFDAVSVETPRGLVILRGEVSTNAARTAAENVARVFAPDRYVANAIEIAPPGQAEDIGPETTADDIDHLVEGRLRRIFSTVQELSQVQVHSSGGIVVLSGTTNAGAALDRAVELTQAQDDVVYVDNDVVVETSLGEQLQATWSRLKDKTISLAGRLPMLAIALLVILLGVFFGRRVRSSALLGRLLSSHAVLQTVLLRLASTAVVVASVVIALDLLEATSVAGAILGTAGVAGIAVAFAFKDIIENYLAGILLAVGRPFAPGDAVKIAGHEGKVVGLAARETLLMTYDGNHVQIPNAQVFGEAIVNYSRNPRRRFDFTLGIGNGESLARVQELVLAVLLEMKGVMNDPTPLVRVEAFGDSSMTVRVHGWVDQALNDFGNVRGEAIRQTKRALDEAGVDMPNPITQVITTAAFPVQNRTREKKETSHDLGVNTEIDKQIADAPPIDALLEA